MPALQAAEKLCFGGFWEGHDFSRAVKSPKINRALAPDDRLCRQTEFFPQTVEPLRSGRRAEITFQNPAREARIRIAHSLSDDACFLHLSCSTEMTDNWKPYLCKVNGKPASILVNLGLRESVPMSSKPWLLWVWVCFQSPRPDGLSDGKEAPTLYKIEDALAPTLARECGAILSGRITMEGWREFYFYGETKDGFGSVVRDAMKGFDDYKFDVGEQEDLSWNQYLNVLYPSLEDQERIANMDLLDKLVEQGDVLTAPREVQHWISFHSEQSRALFREAAAEAGYRIVGEHQSDGELPFGISISRIQSIEREFIDQTVIALLKLCGTFDGDYEGWETPVITQ
jgi:uncharacterized protein (TIGR01619 family)